jgi:cyclase
MVQEDRLFVSRAIGSRGRLVTFDDLVASPYGTTTNIYVLEAGRRLLVCDTYLGPDALRPALAGLLQDVREVVVVNTHADWDHVWGNCLFPGARIIGHRLCRERLKEIGETDLSKFARWQRGPIMLVPPTVTFEDRLDLPEFDVQLFFTPGHTPDSISLYDSKDRVLVVGDNAERPIPSCIDPANLEAHVDSLAQYLTYDFETVVPGHGELLSEANIRADIEYLQALRRGDTSPYEQEPYRLNHLENLRRIREC